MKKYVVYFITLLVCMYVCPDTVIGEEFFVEEKSVNSVYIQSLNTWIFEDEIYVAYKTVNKAETDFICYLLDTLHINKPNIQLASDGDYLFIRINYNDGSSEERLLSPMIKGNALYWRAEDDYNRFIDIVYGLQTGKISLDEYSNIPSQWAESEVVDAIQRGYIPKIHQINYSKSVNRVDVCQIAVNFLYKHDFNLDNKKEKFFLDTKDNSVLSLASIGVISGKSEDLFMPYDFVTREEMAKILSNLWHYINSDLVIEIQDSNYNDSEEISSWAKAYVDEMSTIGILKGDDNGNFSPQRHMTKEEVIVSLVRLFEL